VLRQTLGVDVRHRADAAQQLKPPALTSSPHCWRRTPHRRFVPVSCLQIAGPAGMISAAGSCGVFRGRCRWPLAEEQRRAGFVLSAGGAGHQRFGAGACPSGLHPGRRFRSCPRQNGNALLSAGSARKRSAQPTTSPSIANTPPPFRGARSRRRNPLRRPSIASQCAARSNCASSAGLIPILPAILRGRLLICRWPSVALTLVD